MQRYRANLLDRATGAFLGQLVQAAPSWGAAYVLVSALVDGTRVDARIVGVVR